MMRVAIFVTVICLAVVLLAALTRALDGIEPAAFCEAYRYSPMRDVPAQCYGYFVNPPAEKK